VSADFVAAMEDVLDLYAEPYDAARPVVCFDESPKQLIAEVRQPLPLEPGQPARYDVEYKRNGVRNLLMICEPKRGWREVLVTTTRNKIDFARAMKQLVQTYADAGVIRVVLDNLNTHKIASLYEAFPPDEARALARKLEFHFTPKHGSWLNIAEIEFAVLSNMCLRGRIGEEATLKRIVAANVAERNMLAQPVRWRFTTADARQKLRRLYPAVSA
jgi:DDE superfamily endonuclease